MKSLIALGLVVTACTKTPATGTLDGGERSRAPVENCPTDLLAARGTPCAVEGKTCNGGVPDPRRLLMCSRGTWTEMNVPPMPPPAPK